MLQDRLNELHDANTLFPAPAQAEKVGGEPKAPRDIRPGIMELQLASSSPLSLEFELMHSSKLYVKPSELLPFFQPPNLVPKIVWRVTRLELKASDGRPLFHA
jgi:hypothetical protein